MTKNIGVKISIIIAAVFFIGASKPSLDGRALVASAGELPPGLYVKAAAFLPGDTVLITNPAAKVSIEALVFGTFSPSEGVAVVLSPEAADVLLITKGSNSIVQLTKSGSDTERSVLAKAFDKAAETSPKEALDDSVPYEDYVKSAVQDASVEERQTPSEAPVSSPKEEREGPSFAKAPAENAALIDPSGETAAEDAASESIAASLSEPENTVLPEMAAEPEIAAVSPADTAAEEVPEDTIPVEEEQVFTPFADIAYPHADAGNADAETPETAPVAEAVSEAEIPEEIAMTEPETESGADTAELSDELAAPLAASDTAESPETEPAVPEEVSQDIAVSESEFVYDEPLVETAETERLEEEEVQSVAEPNILIAADDNPPVFEETDGREDIQTSSEVHNVLPDYFTYSQEDEVPFAETPLYDGCLDFDTEHYLIDSLAAFGKGSYCIQLATYKNKAYIVEVFEKYGNKYPVRLLKSEKLPEAYQILIGPLNKDEYPIVLKRFVSRGFKDAFVRTVR